MLRIFEVEIKKLHSSKMWWMIMVGSILPAVITYLSFLERADLSWLEFIHVALLNFNVQSLLTFSAFAAFLCAREYEENTMEVNLCYPYPRYYFLIVKWMIMLCIIAITTILFVVFTLSFGALLLSLPIEVDLLLKFILVLLQVIVMHFLLVPAAIFIAMLSRMAISGVVVGIVSMCLCMMLYQTNFIQYIPPCIPFVLSDHLLGMDVMLIEPNYIIHWSILGGYSVLLSLSSCIVPVKVHGKE